MDKIYLQERDFIPTDAYRKYWYAKLVLAFRNPDTFYPLINALKSNNLNIEGTPKIPEYMFTIFESWFDIVKYNKIDKSKFDDLNAAREKLPKLDKFRLIADAIYLT